MPIQKRGALTLLEGFIPDGLSRAATAFVESLKINSISEKQYRGRRVVVKRRNRYGKRGADLINFYFRLADIPMRYLSNLQKWRRWETKCFQMLNGDRFRASVKGARAVCLDKLPGQTLWDHVKRGSLNKHLLSAAGRELYRAHQFPSEEFGSRWSHGDASTINVIYDKKANRARLIDFEIVHLKTFPAAVRQADDLLVFLLDLIGTVPSRQWLPFAICFLNAYGDRRVIAELKKQLVVPSGLALIWWNVRTNFAKSSRVKRRLRELRNAIAKRSMGSFRLHGSEKSGVPRPVARR